MVANCIPQVLYVFNDLFEQAAKPLAELFAFVKVKDCFLPSFWDFHQARAIFIFRPLSFA
jgi:hypothetical protein